MKNRMKCLLRSMLLSLLVILTLALAACGGAPEEPTPEEPEVPEEPTYTVTFVVNDEEYRKVEVPAHERFVLPDVPTPEEYEENGLIYTFSEWISDTTSLDAIIDMELGRDWTFTAQFSRRLIYYHLSFDDAFGNVMVKEVQKDANFTIPDAPKTPEDGDFFYEFEGWFDENGVQLKETTSGYPTGMGGWHEYKHPPKATADAYYTARYTVTPIYTVTYRDGETLLSTERVVGGKPIPSPVMKSKTVDGVALAFVGWYDEYAHTFSTTIQKASRDTSYLAVYSCPEYHFFACKPAVYDGMSLTPCILCDVSCSLAGNQYATPNIKKVRPDTTCKVTFLDYEGALVSEKTVRYGDRIGSLPTAPKRTNCNFLGWYAGGDVVVGADGDEKLSSSTRIFTDVTVRAFYSCTVAHVFSDEPEAMAPGILCRCLNCNQANLYSPIYLANETTILPFEITNPKEPNTFRIRDTIEHENGDSFVHYVYERDGEGASGPVSVYTPSVNSIGATSTDGFFVINLRLNTDADEGQTVSASLAAGYTAADKPDGDGESRENSLGRLGLFYIQGNRMYRGSGKELIYTFASDDFTEITVWYRINTKEHTADFTYYVDDVLVATWHRTGIQLVACGGIYLNITLNDAGQFVDVESFASLSFVKTVMLALGE